MITKITFWCQKVLPLVFDDSLSYYEQLCKVVDKLNEVISDTNKAFNQLESDVNAELDGKQDVLVSGENIKTINGESVLGSGNIEIQADDTDVVGNPEGDATDGDLTKIKIGNNVYSIHDYSAAIANKQDKLVSGTNIKTINDVSVLGNGNISIETGTAVEGNPTDDATDGDLTKIKIGNNVYSIHDYTSALAKKVNLIDNLPDTTAVVYAAQRRPYSDGSYYYDYTPIQAPLSSTAQRTIARRGNDGSIIAEPTSAKKGSGQAYSKALVTHKELDDEFLNKQDTIPMIVIEAKETATQGNLNDAQKAIIETAEYSVIKFNNELYYLNDVQHQAGSVGYTHAGYENQNYIIKNITCTITTEPATWALNTTNTGAFQTKLVSGSNIKTVNGASLLGSGNMVIQGGSSENLHASMNGTFLAMPESGLPQGIGSYTANFYRVGGLATFEVEVTYSAGHAGEAFGLTINIPEEYRPSKDIQISTVVNTPTTELIWKLLSNNIDNLATGTIPTSASDDGWEVGSDSYKTIPQNGEWTLDGGSGGDYFESTMTVRCVYVM